MRRTTYMRGSRACARGGECFDLSVMRTGAVDNIERITNTYATSDVADEFARCRALVQPSNAP